ncbi:RNA polymerase sigma-70 factor [Rapidithrix thailandica]|uniref:RNA polymerase sigma-70 factor n=1 Tax=Rapidithrix thailandica TaxID=413964 RepID=A0AAW9RYS3_9BACT
MDQELLFEELYRSYWKKLYAFCYAKTKNHEVAEEIVQDVFIALWKRADKIVFSPKTENYLIKSTRNKIVDYYRAKKEQQTTTISQCTLCDEKGFGMDTVAHNLAVDEFLEKDLQLLVNQLPCRCQEVYRLSREKHLTTSEIAEQLNISQKTVKNHLTKALSFINKHLKVV